VDTIITERQATIGLDIGDAETIAAFATAGNRNTGLAIMPGKKFAGQAMPTLYGITQNKSVVYADDVADSYEGLTSVAMNFKRRPSDLVYVSEARKSQLVRQFEHYKLKIAIDRGFIQDPALVNQPEIQAATDILSEPEFRKSAIMAYSENLKEFVNTLINDQQFIQNATTYVVAADSVQFCVGHPTKWDKFDAAVYEAMLQRTDLGKSTYLNVPLFLTVHSESRAALLYVQDTYGLKLSDNKYIGLMDIGSSTIDISVILKDSKIPADFGNEVGNYLGARCIDYLIADQYFFECMDDTLVKAKITDTIKYNKSAYDSLLINCRFAKESAFTSTTEVTRRKARIDFVDYAPSLTYKDLVEDICNRPIAPILRGHVGMPEREYHRLGDRGYIEAFQYFLEIVREQMEEQNIELDQMFLTGSASQMDFVRPTMMKVFPELSAINSLLNDTEPSNAIAKGLARVGLSDRTAFKFEADVANFFDMTNGNLIYLIRKRIPDLADMISSIVVDTVVEKIVMTKMRAWQRGDYETLKEAKDAINMACSDQDKMNELLFSNPKYSEAVKIWMEDRLGADIGTELQRIAVANGVGELDAKAINIFSLHPDYGNAIAIRRDLDLLSAASASALVTVLSSVTGIIAAILLPIALGIVVGLMSLIFETLAVMILAALSTVTGGLVLLGGAALGGLFAVDGVRNWYQDHKEALNQKLQTINIPIIMRQKVQLDKLAGDFKENRETIIRNVAEGIKEEKNIMDMAKGIYDSIYGVIRQRIDDIKCFITDDRQMSGMPNGSDFEL
jgi:molecular chaperone DnaK (HSP70)